MLKTKVSGVDGNRTVEATKGRLVLSLIDGDDYASVLQRVVTAAHHHLRLDAVYISELTPGIETYRAVAGDAAAFGVRVGDTATRETALCELVVTGQLPALVRDTRADGGIAGLPATTVAGVRAYIGVPLVYSDGTVHGMICGLGRSPDASLDDRDVRFMAMLAELLVDRLDERRELDRLRSSINELIADSQLDIAAQPIVDLRDGHCLGVEALSRFRPPFGAPDATFAAATTVGLGLDLERLAVQRAWDLLPYLRADQFVTVNLSPTSALTLARRAQTRSDLPLSQLVVEITEHSAIESYTDLRNELKPLRQAGLRVAVDDAGAGYASLRHVVELSPDFIKIDRDLIHGVADDHARRVAVSAFVLLALDLNVTVVAEGLERHHDLETLRDLGVDAAQGHLFGKPSTNRRHLSTWLRRADLPARQD